MRQDPALRAWSARVRARDGYRCIAEKRYSHGPWRTCGSRDRIQAHHIIPRSECGKSAARTLDVNGATLCFTCHVYIGRNHLGERKYQARLPGRCYGSAWLAVRAVTRSAPKRRQAIA